ARPGPAPSPAPSRRPSRSPWPSSCRCASSPASSSPINADESPAAQIDPVTPSGQAASPWLPAVAGCDNRLVRRGDITAGVVSRLVGAQFPRGAGLPVPPVQGGGGGGLTIPLRT